MSAVYSLIVYYYSVRKKERDELDRKVIGGHFGEKKLNTLNIVY